MICAIDRRGEKTAVKKTPEPTSPGITQTPYVLTPEEKADIDASLAEAEPVEGRWTPVML